MEDNRKHADSLLHVLEERLMDTSDPLMPETTTHTIQLSQAYATLALVDMMTELREAIDRIGNILEK